MAITFRQMASPNRGSADALTLANSEARFADFWTPALYSGVLLAPYAHSIINDQDRTIFLASNNGVPAAYMSCVRRDGHIEVDLLRALPGVGATVQRNVSGAVLRQFMTFWRNRGHKIGKFTVTEGMLTQLRGIFTDAQFAIVCDVTRTHPSVLFPGQIDVEVEFA